MDKLTQEADFEAKMKTVLFLVKIVALGALLAVVIYFTYEMIQPHLSPLLWAGICSVPLHSVKNSLIEYLYFKNGHSFSARVLRTILNFFLGLGVLPVLLILMMHGWVVWKLTGHELYYLKPSNLIWFINIPTSPKRTSNFYFKVLHLVCHSYLSFYLIQGFGFYLVVGALLGIVVLFFHLIIKVIWSFVSPRLGVSRISAISSFVCFVLKAFKSTNYHEMTKKEILRQPHPKLVLVIMTTSMLLLTAVPFMVGSLIYFEGQVFVTTFLAEHPDLMGIERREILLLELQDRGKTWLDEKLQESFPGKNTSAILEQVYSTAYYVQKRVGGDFNNETFQEMSLPKTQKLVQVVTQVHLSDISFSLIYEAGAELWELFRSVIALFVGDDGISGRLMIFAQEIFSRIRQILTFFLYFFTTFLDVSWKALMFFSTLYYLVGAKESLISFICELFRVRGDSNWQIEIEKVLISTIYCSLKMGVFYFIFGVLTFTFYQIEFVYLLSFISSIIAFTHVSNPAWISAIPLIQLVSRGELISGISLFATHVLCSMYVNEAIYNEIPEEHREIPSWVTSTCIILGLYTFGIKGVILGPLVATILIIFYQSFKSYFTTEQSESNVKTNIQQNGKPSKPPNSNNSKIIKIESNNGDNSRQMKQDPQNNPAAPNHNHHNHNRANNNASKGNNFKGGKIANPGENENVEEAFITVTKTRLKKKKAISKLD